MVVCNLLFFFPLMLYVFFVPISGPREDATRIGSAGVVRRQAVDISPLRRVNQAIYLLTTGARESAFRNVKTIAECLADELINAAKGSSNRYCAYLPITCYFLQSYLQSDFISSPFFIVCSLTIGGVLRAVMQSRRRMRSKELPRPTVKGLRRSFTQQGEFCMCFV